MRHTVTRSKCSSPSRANGTSNNNNTNNAVLPPNKVAELVRQLAEAQYEAQQLRQQMESVQRENTYFRASMTRRYDEEESIKNLKQQQSNHKVYNTNSVNSTSNNSNNNRNCIENPNFIDRLLSSSQKVQATRFQSSQNESDEKNLTPQHKATKFLDKPTSTNEELLKDNQLNSSTELYWKRKYAKLKRVHQKAIMDRDIQLAEVQRLVFQIHEEHDELRHRHEQDRLQQQLEQESKTRQFLEARAKSLEEEVTEWRQKFMRVIDDPKLLRGSTLLPSGVILPLSEETGDSGGIKLNPPEGLNQTDRSSIMLDSAFASMMETETPQQNLHATTINRQSNIATDIKKNNISSQKRWQYLGEGNTSNILQGRNILSGRILTPPTMNRSIGIQVGTSSSVAATQTETCSQKSVSIQANFDSKGEGKSEVKLHSIGELEWMHRVQKETPTIFLDEREKVSTPNYYLNDTTTRNSGSLFISRPVQNEKLKDHLYYSVNEVNMNDHDSQETSPLFKRFVEKESGPSLSFIPPPPPLPLPVTKGELSTTAAPPPPLYTTTTTNNYSFNSKFDRAFNGDEEKRERLEEDIRRHDKLLEAVGKVQRQAQSIARTPSC